MTAAEKQAKLQELNSQYTELGAEIQKRTEAARALNAENKVLMEQRGQLRNAIHALEKLKVEDGTEN